MRRHGFVIHGWLCSMITHLALLILLAIWVQQKISYPNEADLVASLTADQSPIPVESLNFGVNHIEAPPSSTEFVAPGDFTSSSPEAEGFSFAGNSASNPLDGVDLSQFGESFMEGSSRADESNARRSASFFGSVAYGDSFVFVLDVSGSMRRQNRYSTASAELISSIGALSDVQFFSVLLFSNTGGTRAMFDTPLDKLEMLPGKKEHKERLTEWLKEVRPDGFTDPREAILAAIQLSPDAIFVLSDGAFYRGQKSFGVPIVSQFGAEVNRLVAGANLFHQIPIHTIAFVDPESKETLRTMAVLSRGTFRFVSDPNIVFP